VDGIPSVVPSFNEESNGESMMKSYESRGSGAIFRNFSQMRTSLNEEWENLPKIANAISEEMHEYQNSVAKNN
jgi:hypothetical protein